MAKGYATRRYQLTINNPQEHGYDHNVIKAALEKGAKLLYWCMADEVGQEETYHIHLFLVYENPVMFTTLKNKFPTAHIEVPQWGKNSENYAYIRKEGAKYNKDANGHYKYTDSKGKVHEGINYSDTFEESGSLPPDSKQGDRNDLRTLYALIASGADNAQILGEHPEYLRDISHIDRTRQTILEEKYRNVFRQMTVTYIFGPTGTGKTRSVKEGCGYSNCYAVSDYHHPFDGYRGQKVMLFDEFHSSLPLNSMLQYLDGYPLELPCRYANKQACYTEAYIISNLPLEKQYVSEQHEKPEAWDALLRRINCVRVFDLDGSHKDYTVHEYFHPCTTPTFEQIEIDDCPFYVYQDLKQKHAKYQHIWDKKQRYKWDRQPITNEQIALIHKLAPDYKIDTHKMTRGDASRAIQLLTYKPEEWTPQTTPSEVQDDAKKSP